MLRWHRLVATLAFPLILYVIATGVGIQLADLSALVSHAPPTNPNMLMLRQHIYGPPNYAVVSAPDYVAPPLPADLDYVAALQKAAKLGHAAAPGASLRLVEIRGVNGRPAGHVRMQNPLTGDKELIFDLASGASLPAADLPPPEPSRDFRSLRSDFKFFHRFNYLGQPATALDGLAGMALATMMITGIIYYSKLYRARMRQARSAPFWSIGKLWRDAHRWISVLAALPVLWIAVTGFLLSADNFAPVIRGALSGPPPAGRRGPNPFDGDLSSPLSDAQLPAMTTATLQAFHQHVPATGVKVLRLRYFVGYPQGVVVAADPATTQYVFNTTTGAAMTMTEKNYPDLGFPSGWEGHQLLKRIHRGDIFGLTGRWLDLFGGVSALFLMLSGLIMYGQLWRRRAKSGRRALLWR